MTEKFWIIVLIVSLAVSFFLLLREWAAAGPITARLIFNRMTALLITIILILGASLLLEDLTR
jgi:general stress protein CsbA